MKKEGIKTFLKRLFITMEFFGKNGLVNHAAACAYGFLLSAAPALLLVAFVLLAAFRSSPRAIAALVMSIPYLDIVLDEQQLARDVTTLIRPGVSGFISVAGLFWAGRIFALSLQRGLKVIFSGSKKRNPVTDNLVVIIVEGIVLVSALLMILCSQTAFRFYEAAGFLPEGLFILGKLRPHVLPALLLGSISYFSWWIITPNPPKRLSAFWGTCVCVVSYEICAAIFGLLLNQTRYNFLYGALGNLVILLINVYLFFNFFFFGAQFAKIIDSFDALLFSKLHWARTSGKGIVQKLFFPVEGRLENYLRSYSEGETVFHKGGAGNEVYYLLEGEVSVFVDDGSGAPAGVLPEGSFFGEMSHLLSESRTATIRAKTKICVLALPPALFDEVIQYDTTMDRVMLEHLSLRLKHRNEQLSALGSGAGSREEE